MNEALLSGIWGLGTPSSKLGFRGTSSAGGSPGPSPAQPGFLGPQGPRAVEFWTLQTEEGRRDPRGTWLRCRGQHVARTGVEKGSQRPQAR